MSIRTFPSIDLLNAAVASAISELASKAIAAHGAFTLMLSGGNTPRALYRLLAKEYATAIDWKHVQIFWGDERYVPHNDVESNYRMAKQSLIDAIDIPLENVHAVPILMTDTEEAIAARYAAVLQEATGQEFPEFDLILLGLGNDGHTASLFPDMTPEAMTKGFVIATHSPVAPFPRISVTLFTINNARNVFFLVAGEEKRQILKAVLADEGNPETNYPAARVHPRGELVWFVDEA